MQVEIYLQRTIIHLKHKYDELRQDAEIVRTRKFLFVPKFQHQTREQTYNHTAKGESAFEVTNGKQHKGRLEGSDVV